MVVETQTAACEALANLWHVRAHRRRALERRAVHHLLPLLKAGEHYTVELRENSLRALAALCAEPEAQEVTVAKGGLASILEGCANEGGSLLKASIVALSALARNRALRLQIAMAGGLRLLCNASCAAQKEIQVRSSY